MEENFFEELKNNKDKIKNLIHQAYEFKWIDENKRNEILNKIDNDTLVIGVIGQMKCGKSTFLNSFVFENNILPAATTPMTATLSIITYGEKEKIVAEFYNSEEWKEQQMQASRSIEDVRGNDFEETKIKAAKELVEKASKLGSKLNSYLGKKQEDSFENLIEYVGADGKYISITKSVTIYYPKEYLKGVEIVDTPGFNDPIVSREERTKAFLNKADVVLLMLYAGRPFDATDRAILFKNIHQCGIGKILIGINKYDIPYENGETEEEIKNYVIKEIKEASRNCDDETLVELLKETEPIPLSAEMALLSELPMSKIEKSDILHCAWNRQCSTFEISSQKQMRQLSLIDNLINAIKDLVEKQKGKILFAKPLNAIKALENTKKEKIATKIRNTKDLVQNLSMPDYELEEKKINIEKAQKRINKQIDKLKEEIESNYKDGIKKGSRELTDIVNGTCSKMELKIGAWKKTKPINIILDELDYLYQHLIKQDLKLAVEDIHNSIISSTRTSLQEFFGKIEDIIRKYTPDLDSEGILMEIKNKINSEVDPSLFTIEQSDEDNDEDYGIIDMVFDVASGFLTGATFGMSNVIGNMINHNNNVAELKNYVRFNIQLKFEPSEFLNPLNKNKDEIVQIIKEKLITETLTPLQNNIDDINKNIKNKEKQLNDAQNQLLEYNKEQQQLQSEIDKINSIL